MKRYVKAVGADIHDINNKPFLLKGVGIGSWLLIEGYMLKSFGSLDRPRVIEKHIKQMTSKDFAKMFYQKWYETFFTEEDIVFIKNCGFNSIRIPIDYQFLYYHSNKTIALKKKPSHFAILDNIIDLCHKHQIYVILDMHAAPGGQTGTNIDNSENNQPQLFQKSLYQKQLIYIWQDIAKKYKEKEYIACYDILNEPLPKWFHEYNDLLIPLYEEVIHAIRAVDRNHMITLEGLHWSTDLSIFTKRLDNNLMLQFHKYWSNPDVESIKPYLTIRDTLSLPLFMGEGGENNVNWYYAIFKLYTQKNISFNFWTYKKMSTHNSPISFQTPTNWDMFLEGNLSKKEAENTLLELLNNIQFQNTTQNQDVVNHVLSKDTLFIPAYAYDYHGENISFKTHNITKHQLRANDHMHFIDDTNKTITPNFKQYNGAPYQKHEVIHLKLFKGDWVNYSFTVSKSNQLITITLDISNPKNISVFFDGSKLESKPVQTIKTIEQGIKILRIKANEDVVIKEIKIESKK